jgi:hypothetical protein
VGADVPGGAFASSGIRADILSVYFRQEERGRKRSTLIHTSSGIRADFLSVYFRQEEKQRRQKKDRVVEDSVMIACR